MFAGKKFVEADWEQEPSCSFDANLARTRAWYG
jgi:hypothetical protein